MVRTETIIDKCSFNGELNEIRITLTKRTRDDKATIKLARTAYWCSKGTCADIINTNGEIGTFNERELKRDLGIDFVW